MTEKGNFDLYLFHTSPGKNQKLGLIPDFKSNSFYRISLTSGKANAILSFSLPAQEPTNIKNVTGYEVYFTKELLNKETITLSEKLELFKSELPRMFLLSPKQEWRVKAIFESMLDESTRTGFHGSEMIQTLLYELILFSQRLEVVDAF